MSPTSSDRVGGRCGVATTGCSCGSVAGHARALATLLGLGQLRSRRKLGQQHRFLLGGAFLALTLGCCKWIPKPVWVGIVPFLNASRSISSTLVQLRWVGFCRGFLFLLAVLLLYSWLWVVAWAASCLVMSSWASCGARHCCLVFWSKMFGDAVVNPLVVLSVNPSCAGSTPNCIVFRPGFPSSNNIYGKAKLSQSFRGKKHHL